MLKISNYLPKFLKKSKIKVDIESKPLRISQKSSKDPKAGSSLDLKPSYTSSRGYNKYNPRLDKWYNILTEEERKEWMNDRVEVSTPTNSHDNNFHRLGAGAEVVAKEEERKKWYELNDHCFQRVSTGWEIQPSVPTNSHVNNFHHEEQKEYADLFDTYFNRISRNNTDDIVKKPFDSNLSKYKQLEEKFKILEDRNKLLEKKLKMLEEQPEKYKMLKKIDPFDEENWESL